VRIQRGRRLIQLHSYDLIPHLEAQKIRAGDRVTLYSWMGGICRVPTASFVRAGSEQALIWGF
jgi:hypothetical protein